MRLEQTLEMYEVERGESDRANTSSGLYELLSGNCGGKVGAISFGIGGMGTEGGSLKLSKDFEAAVIKAKYASRSSRGRLDVSPNTTRLFMEGNSTPVMRVDRNAHHGKPADHLQYGDGLYTGRNGNEAYDILGEIFRLNPQMSLTLFSTRNKSK
tara:strand:+ start:381 stop:845 length:465 start_codon:yes stop_codon:yes gene_type:complete